MKKTSIKAVSIILTLLMIFGVFCVVPVSVGAEGTGISSLSVTPADTESSSDIRGINWYYYSKDNSYYIFSPQTYDKSALRLWFDASDTVTCGGEALVSGEVTDIFASGQATLNCGGSSYLVKVLDGGDVGSVQITTESGSLDNVHADKDNREPGNILVSGGDGTVMYDGALDYIKGRGNSTWNGAKKPYNIKLAKKADLFGMGKAKKWCLLANAGDATFMRNLLCYKFANDIGVDTTSDVVPVNFYANGNYMGAYVITEKVEIGENRIDIRDLEGDTEKANDNADLESFPIGGAQGSMDANTYQYAQIPNNPEDITGGYLLELEKIYRYPPEVSGFITSRSQAVVVKEPEYASKEQVEYIRDYYQQYENAVYSFTGYNDLGKYYTEYVDVESIARMYIAEEFAANFDGCSSSFFLYKDVDGKIMAGPAWDFDLSFQQSHGINYLINNICPLDAIDSLYIQHCYINYDNSSNKSFLAQLFTHNDFQQVVQNVWNNVVKEMYPSFFAFIGAKAESIHSTIIMNAIRWNTYGTSNAQSIINGYNNRLKIITDYIPQRYEFLSHAYSDETYFVKYDIGTYNSNLVFDTTIYNGGDTAVVKDLPDADADRCCMGWYQYPDYSGEPLAPGSEITVTDNTNLYGKWVPHNWVQCADDPNLSECSICGRYMLDGSLLTGWYGEEIYANGKPAKGEWVIDENGKRYKYGNDYVHSRWRELDGRWYYFGNDAYAYTGIRFLKLSASADPEWYDFGNGEGMPAKERLSPDGLYTYNGDLYYVVNGYSQSGAQLIDGEYYFFREGSGYERTRYAAKNETVVVNSSNSNGVLENGNYYFGEDSKLIKESRLIGNKVFVNGKQLPAYYGLVRVGSDFYYVNTNGDVIRGKSYYINNTNGLKFDNGKAIPRATYEFGADGKMLIPEGIVDDTIYIDGVKVPANYGLVKFNGDFYYVGANAKIVKDAVQNVTKTNGLKLNDGSDIPADYYYFDVDGKMSLPGVLIGDYYYINGVRVGSYYGLVKYQGNYYYVNNNAKIIKDKDYFLNNTNKLTFADGTPIPKQTYHFDEEGKMVIPSGIKGDYYYLNGVRVGSYYGLVEFEGDYYYVNNNAKIIRDKEYFLNNTNNLKFADGTPIPKQSYYFDADGKMVIPSGLKGDFYYVKGVRVGSYYGLVKDGDYYYYISDYAKIVKNKNVYINNTNGLKFADGTPIPKDTYHFDEEGRMVIPSGVRGDYYYINGVRVGSYYGLVKDNGYFYYVCDNAKIVRNKRQMINSSNGLTFDDGTPVPKKYYYFDADGRMVIE